MRAVSANDWGRSRDCANQGCPLEAENGSPTCGECKKRAAEDAARKALGLDGRIMLGLQAGPARATELAFRIGAMVPSVKTRLAALAREGRLDKIDRGVYALPEKRAA